METTPQGVITIEVLSSLSGDSKIFINESSDDERAGLAEQINMLIEKGHAVFLAQGNDARRIREYDPETNEWIVTATVEEVPPEMAGKGKRKYTKRMPGNNSTITSVPPMAGG